MSEFEDAMGFGCVVVFIALVLFWVIGTILWGR
jgi:hypothetical protein